MTERAPIAFFATIVVTGAGLARAEESCARPLVETSTWVALGGGVARLPNVDEPEAVFDLGLGTDVTLGVDRDGDVRLGPWIEVRTADFWDVSATAGVELFFGAAPAALDLFQYEGEGVLSVRLGGGWEAHRDAPFGAVVSGTVAYGYRAPFDLWSSFDCDEIDADWSIGSDAPRAFDRYMTGVRIYATGQYLVGGAAGWQITAGLELEPLGSFRYLLGLY